MVVIYLTYSHGVQRKKEKPDSARDRKGSSSEISYSEDGVALMANLFVGPCLWGPVGPETSIGYLHICTFLEGPQRTELQAAIDRVVERHKRAFESQYEL